MKNRFAVLGLMLIVLLGGILGLVGCGDKYQNLKIDVTGEMVSTDDGQRVIDIEYDQEDATNNVITFSAQISGYTEDMRTTMTLSVPQDQARIDSKRIRGPITTFNVQLLTSGIMKFVVYSDETSKVFATLTVRALLRTQAIDDKQANLNLMRPSQGSAEYVLDDESLVDFTPYYSTARDLVYTVNGARGISIVVDEDGTNKIKVENNATLGIVPITVRSSRLVLGSEDYDTDLTDEQKTALTTTIYAFVYDYSWQLGAFNSNNQIVNSVSLSNLSSQYNLTTKLLSVISEEAQEVELNTIADVYPVFSAYSNNTNILSVDAQTNNEFLLYSGIEGSTKLTMGLDLYYVPGLDANMVINDFSQYRKVMSYQKDLNISVVKTPTGLMLTNNSNGVTSTTNISMGIFEQNTVLNDDNEEVYSYGNDASVDINILPLTLAYEYRKLSLEIKAIYNGEDYTERAKEVLNVYYYHQNILKVLNLSSDESEVIPCGVNGVRLYVAFDKETTDVFDRVELKISTINITDVYDVVSSTIICNLKEGVKQIKDVVLTNNVESSIIHVEGVTEDALTNYAYISLDDKTNGVACSVKYLTNESQGDGITDGNQVFSVSVPESQDVLRVGLIENSNRFVLYPINQGSVLVTITSENNKTYEFIARVVLGATIFSIDYQLSTGTLGEVTYKTDADNEDDVVVKDYGLKEMYIQTDSRIILNNIFNPTNADVIIANQPYTITAKSDGGVSSGVIISSSDNMGQRILTLRALRAGEYSIKCTANTFVKDINGIWQIQPINREFTLYVFNPVNGVVWNINGEQFYGSDELVYEIYDNDAVAFDLQNTFPVQGLTTYDDGIYYLNPMGFKAFEQMGYPSLNPSQLNAKKQLFINFSATPYCNDRLSPNYINSETVDENGVVTSVIDPTSPLSLHYSIDYSSTSVENKLASIISIGVGTKNYEANNSTQAYASSSIWMGFTSVLSSDAKQYVYEYHISAIIKQANRLTTTSVFTLRIIQPMMVAYIDTPDEIELEYGGLNTPVVPVSVNIYPNNAYDSRWVYSLAGVPFTFDMLQQTGVSNTSSKKPTSVLDNGIICFDPNTMQISLSDGYTGGSTDTSITFWSIDSLSILRNKLGDKYYAICQEGTNPYLSASPNNGEALGLYVLDGADNMIGGIYKNLVYKTIKVHINAGDTPNSPFLISNATEFANFVSDIRAGKTYAGQYIKVTDNIYGIDLTGIEPSDSIFSGILFADEPVTLQFVNAPYNLLGSMVNASIQNITFDFSNGFNINTAQDAGIIAKSIVYQNVNLSSLSDTYYLVDGAYTTTTTSDNAVYRYIINNVHIVLQNHITLTAANFGVLAGQVQGATIKNSSVTFANLNNTIKGINATGCEAVGGMIGCTTYSSYVNDLNTVIYTPTILNYCIVRMYNNNAIVSDGGYVGGLVGIAESLHLEFSYLFAYNTSYINLYGQGTSSVVGGLVGTISNGQATIISHIQNCFVNANLSGHTLGVLYGTTSSNIGVEYAFANVIANQEVSIIDMDVTQTQVYSYVGVYDNVNLEYVFTENKTSDLDFDNLNTMIWTSAFTEYNNSRPLLLRDGVMLYEDILPAIQCTINDDYVIRAYYNNVVVDESTKIKVRQGQTYLLSSLLNGLDNLARYDVILMPSQTYASVEIIQPTYKNVGNATIQFSLPGVYSLMLVSLQNTTINQTFDFLVSANVSMVTLSTESSGEDVELIGGKTVVAHTNDQYRVDVLNIPNGLDEIAYVRYIVSASDRAYISFNGQTWLLDETSGKYYVDIKMDDINTMTLLGNVSVEYQYVLKYTYIFNTDQEANYQPITYDITEGDGRFAFNISIVPDASLDVSNIELYSSDNVNIILSSNVNSVPEILFGDENDLACLNITASASYNENGTYKFEYNITVKAEYQYLTETLTQTIQFKQNDIIVATLTINILPTPIASVFTTYYFGGTDKIDDSGTQGSHVIIPGGIGVFKLDVDYSYSNYEFINVYSDAIQNTTIFFTQYYKYYLSAENYEYREILNGSVYDENGILQLRKLTGFKNGQDYFDGTYYIATYIPNSVKEDDQNCYYVHFEPKLLEGEGYVNAFDQELTYALYPGFVSTVTLKNVKTAVADNATYLVVTQQTVPLELEMNLRNTTVSIKTSGLTLYSDGVAQSADVEFDYQTNATLNQTNALEAKISALNGETATIKITVTQEGQVVDIRTYEFVVVDKIVPKAISQDTTDSGYHISYDETKNTYSDTLTIYTNIYTTLKMYYDEYSYQPGVGSEPGTYTAELNSEWKDISEIKTNWNAWVYQNELLAVGEYTYFKVEKTTSGGEEYYRLIGLSKSSGLTMKVQAFIYYTKDGSGNYIYKLNTHLPDNEVYYYVQTINYQFTLDVAIGSTEDAPLPIDSADDLKNLNGKTGDYYLLTTDLILDNWVPFALEVTNLDFNNHRVILRSIDLTNQKNASSDSITAGLFTTIGENTLVRNLILDVSMLVYVDAMDKSVVDFGFVAGINNGVIYNVDVVAFDTITLSTTDLTGYVTVDWAKIFDYKRLNHNTNSLGLREDTNETLTDTGWESTLDTFNYDDNRIVSLNTKAIFDSLIDTASGTTPTSVFVLTGGYNSTISSLTTHIGGIAGTNNGFITNSRVGRSDDIGLNNGSENINYGIDGSDHKNKANPINIYASGYVGGLVGFNTNVVSSSAFNGGYVINTATSGASNTKTAGLVAMQSAEGRVYGSYAQGGIEDGKTSASTGGVKSQGTVAGLVHTNNGKIDNSLSNIPLYSSAGVGGMVYLNNGDISTSISLSQIQSSNSLVGGLFVGVNSQQTLQDFGNVLNCYYLLQTGVIQHNEEKAYGLYANGFVSSNLYGFSMTDTMDEFSENYVWYIDVLESGGNPAYADVKLISANKITFGARVNQEGSDDFAYLSGYEWGSKDNPIILGSAQDWDKYFADYNDTSLNNNDELKTQIKNYYGLNNNSVYYRVVGDIDFGDDETYFPQNSYKYTLKNAHIQGNGLTIKNISYITTSETQSGETIGLFSSIEKSAISGVNVVLRDGIIAGNYNIVGTIAGKIVSSEISNINISGVSGSQIVGYQIAGGLAGQVENSNLNNISSNVSVSASYIAAPTNSAQEYTVNAFPTGASAASGAISYAGGVVGVINKAVEGSESYVAQYLTVDGKNIVISAEHAGGVVGMVGLNITLAHAKFVLADPTTNTPNVQRISGTGFVAGGLVGENRGTIQFSCVDYSEDVQKALDSAALECDNINDTLGDLDIFANTNSIAIGGLVGINFGGAIEDSYTRMEVVSKKALIAGGVIGIATAREISNINTSNALLFGNQNELSNVSGNAISNFDRVYTTSFVYAQNCVGGLIGYMMGQAEVTSKTTLVALNKMPEQISNYDYASVVYKGSVIGMYASTNKKGVFQTTDSETHVNDYEPVQYGIFVVNQGGTYHQLVFDYEIGNLQPFSQLYSSFVQGYDVSYLETLQGDSIIFNGMAVKPSIWSIDSTKTSHIMPVLKTGNTEYSTTITDINEWNDKLKHKYGARAIYTIEQDITQSSDDLAFEAFEETKDITIEGKISEENEQIIVPVITVRVKEWFKPLFGKADNLAINNLNFEFDIQTTEAISISSLLCAEATNCAFNNVNITIKTNALALKDISEGTLIFGALVGTVKDKLSIYNCTINGDIKLSGTFASSTNPTIVGGLIGSMAYTATQTTLSTIYSSKFGSLTYNFDNATIQNVTYVGGMIGYVNGAHTIHSASAADANFKLKTNGTLIANANLHLGGIIGYVEDAIVNNIDVAVAGTLNLSGNANVYFGNAFGSLTGASQVHNIISSVYSYTENNTNIIVDLTITASVATNIGGICGQYAPSTKETMNGVIAYCSVNSNITLTNNATTYIGVVVGYLVSTANTNSIIIDSVVAIGDITITNQSTSNADVGGLGGNLNTSTNKVVITNCAIYSLLKVNVAQVADRKVGGIVGAVADTNYEISHSVSYGLIDIESNTAGGNLYVAGGIGYSASNILKLCIIGTGITCDKANATIDAIVNTTTNTDLDSAMTKVYYVPNMIGQFTKFANAISLKIEDVATSLKWDNENFVRVNPTKFANKQANTTTKTYYLTVPSALLNIVPNNERTTLIQKDEFDILSDVSAEMNIWLNSEQPLAVTESIAISNTNIKRLVSDGIQINVNVNMFTTIPRNIIVSGIRLTVPNNALSVTINNNNPFGLLANINNGVVFDCNLGSIISEDIKSTSGYTFVEPDIQGNYNTDTPALETVPYYTAPNYTVVTFTISNTDAYIGGLVGQNNGIVDGCYVYADYVFDTINTSKFGGIVGQNKVLKNSYIIGRQVYTQNMGSAALGKVFSADGTSTNCASYVVQYYNGIPLATPSSSQTVYSVDTTSSTNVAIVSNSDPVNAAMRSIWKQDTKYNYGIYMFARYFNDEQQQSKYYTGDGTSMPYEIIDYAQLYADNFVSEDYDFVLNKNIFVTSAFTTHPDVKGLINGNGHTLFVHSYPLRTVGNVDNYSVFGTLSNTAGIYNLKLHICTGMTLQKSTNATSISFGGLALNCNTNNVQNIAVYTRKTSSETVGTTNVMTINGYTVDSYVGGLFSTYKSTAIMKCYANVQIDLSGCTTSKMFVGALIGRADRPTTSARLLSITMCKIDCDAESQHPVYTMIGKLQTPAGSTNFLTLNIEDCYTTAKVFDQVTVQTEDDVVTSVRYDSDTKVLDSKSFRFVQDSGDTYSTTKNAVNIYSSYYTISDSTNTYYVVYGNLGAFAVYINAGSANIALISSDNTNWKTTSPQNIAILNYAKAIGQGSN